MITSASPLSMEVVPNGGWGSWHIHVQVGLIRVDVGCRIGGPTLSRLGSEHRVVIIGLAEWATGSSACQPCVNADSVEGMTTSQPMDNFDIFEFVDANDACVAADS